MFAMGRKPAIRVDLKRSGLHPELLSFLRLLLVFEPVHSGYDGSSPVSAEGEGQVMDRIAELCEGELKRQETSYDEDEMVLNKLGGTDWRMRFVVWYRMGRKHVLRRQVEIAKDIAWSLRAGGAEFKLYQSASMRNYVSSLSF